MGCVKVVAGIIATAAILVVVLLCLFLVKRENGCSVLEHQCCPDTTVENAIGFFTNPTCSAICAATPKTDNTCAWVRWSTKSQEGACDNLDCFKNNLEVNTDAASESVTNLVNSAGNLIKKQKSWVFTQGFYRDDGQRTRIRVVSEMFILMRLLLSAEETDLCKPNIDEGGLVNVAEYSRAMCWICVTPGFLRRYQHPSEHLSIY